MMGAAELRKLPEKLEEENILIDGRPHTVITWHDEIEAGRHRIVVASYLRAAAGLATRVHAEGFTVSPEGTIRDLSEDELSPFQ
jgi:hypothetical protein